MLNLDNTTLFAMFVPWNKEKLSPAELQDGEENYAVANGIEKTIKAIRFCMKQVNFACVKFITSQEIIDTKGDELIKDGIICEANNTINSFKDYSKFMIYDLKDHINTNFVLTIQYDGFILNAASWREDFFDYDYIGAPWPKIENAFVTPFGEQISVGNGGFSLRSKKLLNLPSLVDIPFDVVALNHFYKMFGSKNWNEDGNICVHNRHIFEQHGCKFAPLEIAKHFSHETTLSINKDIKPFGFHRNLPATLNREEFYLSWNSC